MAPQPVYLKDEVIAKQVLHNDEFSFVLVASMNTVNGFKIGPNQRIILAGDVLRDQTTNARWDIRGKSRQEGIPDLQLLAISDEYWFSWKKYHPHGKLVRL
jgi:hypothetical protein